MREVDTGGKIDEVERKKKMKRRAIRGFVRYVGTGRGLTVTWGKR